MKTNKLKLATLVVAILVMAGCQKQGHYKFCKTAGYNGYDTYVHKGKCYYATGGISFGGYKEVPDEYCPNCM